MRGQASDTRLETVWLSAAAAKIPDLAVHQPQLCHYAGKDKSLHGFGLWFPLPLDCKLFKARTYYLFWNDQQMFYWPSVANIVRMSSCFLHLKELPTVQHWKEAASCLIILDKARDMQRHCTRNLEPCCLLPRKMPIFLLSPLPRILLFKRMENTRLPQDCLCCGI